MWITKETKWQALSQIHYFSTYYYDVITALISIRAKQLTGLLWYGAPFPPKIRSLYSILDLLYFTLPYTMQHPTVLTSWLTFSIVRGTFCFSHSISRIWHAKLNWRFSAAFIKRSTMQVSTFEVLFSTSRFMYLVSIDILLQSIEIGNRGRSYFPAPSPQQLLQKNHPVQWSRDNDPTLWRWHICLFYFVLPGSQT